MRGPHVKSATARWKSQPPREPRWKSQPPREPRWKSQPPREPRRKPQPPREPPKNPRQPPKNPQNAENERARQLLTAAGPVRRGRGYGVTLAFVSPFTAPVTVFDAYTTFGMAVHFDTDVMLMAYWPT